MLELAEPRLKIVTAISSSEHEEKVAGLLHSQGCNIIYRALNYQLLSTFLAQYQGELCVLYTDEFAAKTDLDQLVKRFENHRFVQAAEMFDQRQLVDQLLALSRPPLIHKVIRVKNLISIFGTPGSPGVSTITNHLAALKSAQIFTCAHSNLRPQTSSHVDKLLPSELGQKIAQIKDDLTFIDAGETISLTKTISDRRVTAHWLNQALTGSSKVIYVVPANENGMTYLADFVDDYKKVVNSPEIIFVLNKQRFDRSGQMVQRRFVELVGQSSSAQLPFDHRAAQLPNGAGSAKAFWRSSTFSRQIEKIGNQLL